VKLLDVSVGIAGEFHGSDAPVAISTLLMRTFGAQLQRPERPRRGGGAVRGRLGHDFELMYTFCALAMAGAQTVCAGVAAADDDDVLAGSENGRIGLHGFEERLF
jgi:hypothetical protein